MGTEREVLLQGFILKQVLLIRILPYHKDFCRLFIIPGLDIKVGNAKCL